MPWKRALSNPNLTSLKSLSSFDVTYRPAITPNKTPKNQISWIPDKTQSLPNLLKIDQNFNDKILLTAVKDATRNLRYTTLSFLQQIPIVLNNNLIAKILFILLHCSFSPKIMREDFQYKQRFGSLTFTVLLNNT